MPPSNSHCKVRKKLEMGKIPSFFQATHDGTWIFQLGSARSSQERPAAASSNSFKRASSSQRDRRRPAVAKEEPAAASTWLRSLGETSALSSSSQQWAATTSEEQLEGSKEQLVVSVRPGFLRQVPDSAGFHSLMPQPGFERFDENSARSIRTEIKDVAVISNPHTTMTARESATIEVLSI